MKVFTGLCHIERVDSQLHFRVDLRNVRYEERLSECVLATRDEKIYCCTLNNRSIFSIDRLFCNLVKRSFIVLLCNVSRTRDVTS